MRKKEFIKTLIQQFHQKEIPALNSRNAILCEEPRKIVILTGVRRTGKTSLFYRKISNLLQQRIPIQNIIYLNREDERLLLRPDELNFVFEAYMELYPSILVKDVHFFLDGISHPEEWVDSIMHIYTTRTKNIYLSSSTNDIVKEFEKKGKQHIAHTTLYPLSFVEFMSFNGLQDTEPSVHNADIFNLFNKYIHGGGFPELAAFEKQNKRTFLDAYFNTMIFKDVVEKFNIPNVSILKLFIKLVFSNISNTLSITRIYNELKSSGKKIGKNYLFDFLTYMQESFFLVLLNKYNISDRKNTSTEKKAYVIDNGLITATNYNMSQNKGKLLENAVAMEFIKYGMQPMFFKQYKECDFVIKEDKTYHLYQVCYSFEDMNIKNKELAGLYLAAKELNAASSTIITYDQEREIEHKGIKVNILPAYKFFKNLNLEARTRNFISTFICISLSFLNNFTEIEVLI